MKKLSLLFFVFAFALAACGTPATAISVAATPASAPANAVIVEGHLVPEGANPLQPKTSLVRIVNLRGKLPGA